MKLNTVKIKRFMPFLAIMVAGIIIVSAYSYNLMIEENSLHTIQINQKYVSLYYNQTGSAQNKNSSILVSNFTSASFSSNSADANASLIYTYPDTNLSTLKLCPAFQYGQSFLFVLFFEKASIRTESKLEFTITNITEFNRNNSMNYSFSIGGFGETSNPYPGASYNSTIPYGNFYSIFTKPNLDATIPGVYYLSFTIDLYAVTSYSVSYIGSFGFYHLPWVRYVRT